MSTTKTLFFLVLAVMIGQQVGYADDSGKIRQLEGEMNSLKQATVEQGEKIKTLKSRVGSRDAAWATMKESASQEYNSTDGIQNPSKVRRKIDSSDRRYID